VSPAPAQRLVIHAGFAKCGSSSIQGTLFRNFLKLGKQGVSLFDKNLRIAKSAADLKVPLWTLEDARKKGEHLTPKLANEIAAAAAGGQAAVLSAENLSTPGMAGLFAGIDQFLDVLVVFYVRPQLQWIPSAWMQWGLKKGTSLEEFVAHCLKIHRPAFRKNIEEWQRVLPKAKLEVRFLIPELLKGGHPGADFFHVLGLAAEEYEIKSEASNPSFDFSILHVLSKNPQLFSGVHDNQLSRALRRALPKKFQSSNIRMLTAEAETRIEEFFREENRWLLQTFGAGAEVARIYDSHFMPRSAAMRYPDLGELDVIYRCLGIVLQLVTPKKRESTGGGGDDGRGKD